MHRAQSLILLDPECMFQSELHQLADKQQKNLIANVCIFLSFRCPPPTFFGVLMVCSLRVLFSFSMFTLHQHPGKYRYTPCGCIEVLYETLRAGPRLHKAELQLPDIKLERKVQLPMLTDGWVETLPSTGSSKLTVDQVDPSFDSSFGGRCSMFC